MEQLERTIAETFAKAAWKGEPAWESLVAGASQGAKVSRRGKASSPERTTVERQASVGASQRGKA